MIPILTSAEMREADRRAINELGIPGMVLMENAARGACDVLAEMLGGLAGKRVLIVCGKGNNGGDGFAMARIALNAGAHARCMMLAAPDDLSGDAAAQYRILAAYAPGTIMPWAPGDAGGPYDAIVDAMLGTGATGVLAGAYREAVEWCNGATAHRLAVDIPTGVDADTGAVGSVAFAAERTATMGALKPGLMLGHGAAAAGACTVVGLGAPPSLYQGSALQLLDASVAMQGIPAIDPQRSKHNRGKVMVIAGSPGMTGAGVLAATASVRAGAGLTVLALPALAAASMPQRLAPEVMTRTLASGSDGAFAAEAISAPELAGCSAVAIGPGLSRSEGAAQMARDLIHAVTIPVVLDADGINAFAGSAARLANRHCTLVITPHHGEMARLLGIERTAVAANPIGIAREAAVLCNCIVVLKGAPTVVAEPGGNAWINGAGNPGMATGGTGDVLAGIIAALLAQTANPMAATLSAVYIHSHAADLAAARTSLHSLAASDIISHIGSAYTSLLDHDA